MTTRCSDRTIGLIVNPIAGMGGRVGLKGTDGPAALAEARRRGAQPTANGRVLQALQQLAPHAGSTIILTGSGVLGAEAAITAGFDIRVMHMAAGESSANDTRVAAQAMLEAGVDLLLFAGGDGTARDILDIVGEAVPVVGIPAGVKMVSAVFGTTPANAGMLAGRYLAGDTAIRLREAEVMDIDEDAIRSDRVSTRLYGYARSPFLRAYSQNAKSGSSLHADAALDAVCRDIAREMQPGGLYILGPGSTTRRVMAALDLPATLLGVDAVLDGQLVGADLAEADLLRLMQGRATTLIAGVLGGHGSLFGRGNQQLSTAVLRQIPRERIVVVAAMDKLLALTPRRLFVDTGDNEFNTRLAGHLPVRFAPGRSIVLQVE